MIVPFHCANDSAQDLGSNHVEPQDADLPADAARREVRHASGDGT
jgi:hypothetical protein